MEHSRKIVKSWRKKTGAKAIVRGQRLSFFLAGFCKHVSTVRFPGLAAVCVVLRFNKVPGECVIIRLCCRLPAWTEVTVPLGHRVWSEREQRKHDSGLMSADSCRHWQWLRARSWASFFPKLLPSCESSGGEQVRAEACDCRWRVIITSLGSPVVTGS